MIWVASLNVTSIWRLREMNRAPVAVARRYSFCSPSPAARDVRAAVGGSGSISSTEPPEKTGAGNSMPKKAPPISASAGEVNSRSTLAVAGPVSSTTSVAVITQPALPGSRNSRGVRIWTVTVSILPLRE